MKLAPKAFEHIFDYDKRQVFGTWGAFPFKFPKFMGKTSSFTTHQPDTQVLGVVVYLRCLLESAHLRQENVTSVEILEFLPPLCPVG